MKVKASITLTKETLRAVDKLVGKRGNRSAFIEEAVREYVLAKERELRDLRDIERMNRTAHEHDRSMDEVLRDQTIPDRDV